METIETPKAKTGTDDVYHAYMQRMQASFTKAAQALDVLFYVDVDDLFESYLAALPQEQRQYHNCNCCRNFVNRYGNLVTIDGEGNLHSLIWNPDDAHEPMYSNATFAMKGLVEEGKVGGVFASSLPWWGTSKTGIWEHMSLMPPAKHVYRSLTKSDSEYMAEKKEDLRTVAYALSQYPLPLLDKVLQVLDSDKLYRTEKVEGPAKWLHGLQKSLSVVKGRRRANMLWKAVGEAPAGFCHPRSSMVGTVLDDLAAGKDFEQVKASFNAKMAPLRYQRPTAAPKAGNIEQAEKLVAQMGIADSLKRRIARLDEVLLHAFWTQSQAPGTDDKAGSVFGHLKPKATKVLPALAIPPKVITWVKFLATVLPAAQQVEYLTTAGRRNFMTFVTEKVDGSPQILQWDNPYSWFVTNAGSLARDHDLPSNAFVNVPGIAGMPYTWGGGKYSHFGESVAFLLDGASSESNSLCLFPEILKSELHEVRATIEAYSQAGRMELKSGAAVAIRLTGHDGRIQFGPETFRVTADGVQTLYSIDRWD